jgi:nicotinamide mononucleotide (NMN) deamidase PncC
MRRIRSQEKHMDPQQHALIAAFHAAGHRCVLAVTGGGAGAAAWLLSVPGASRSLLEVIVPYDERSLEDFLKYRPSSFCSLETACDMARRAYERAQWLASGQPVAGLACTASLRSDRPKHGDHRFHLAIQTHQHNCTYSLTLTKEARRRDEEETVLDLVFLNALAESLHLAERAGVPLLPGETIQRQTRPCDDLLTALCEGRLRAVFVEADGRFVRDGPQPSLLLPGSFNPLHRGHCALADAAARRTGLAARFELSVMNADKPALTIEEVRRRLAQLSGRAPVWLTRAPTFVEKAELFPGAVFVVGADTAERIVQPRFYGGTTADLDRAMHELRSRSCRFLVAGRINVEGYFVDLSNLSIPSEHRDLFMDLPAGEFRVDLSSTQLRSEEGLS